MKRLLIPLSLFACRDARQVTLDTQPSSDTHVQDTDRTTPDSGHTGQDPPDTSTDTAIDTGDPEPVHPPMVPLQCTGTGTPDPSADPPTDLGNSYGRVITIDSPEFDQLCAYLTYPNGGEAAWEEGAPVVVYVRPGINAGMDTNPPPAFQGPSGVIEILGIHPALPWYDCETSGDFNFGGDKAALAMAEVMRFGLGLRTTTKGLRIDQLVNQPVCNSAIAVMSSSSGSPTAANALARSPDLANKILGMTTFEPVSMPLFVQAEPGHVYFDPDDEVDGDGNGLTWDDGRNLSFDDASCNASGCINDISTLNWTLTSKGLVSGFWLDRDLDGVHDDPPDINDDGYISIEEDFNFPEPLNILLDGAEISMWSPALIAGAWNQGLVDLENVPPNLPTVQQALDFWEQRDQVSLMRSALEFHHPDFLMMISWSEVPHHIPWTSRPAESVLGDMARENETDVIFNPSLEAAGCLIDEEALWKYEGGVPMNQFISGGDDYDHHSLPETFLPQTSLALATMGLLYEAVKPFDNCDSLSLTLQGPGDTENE